MENILAANHLGRRSNGWTLRRRDESSVISINFKHGCKNWLILSRISRFKSDGKNFDSKKYANWSF